MVRPEGGICSVVHSELIFSSLVCTQMNTTDTFHVPRYTWFHILHEVECVPHSKKRSLLLILTQILDLVYTLAFIYLVLTN